MLPVRARQAVSRSGAPSCWRGFIILFCLVSLSGAFAAAQSRCVELFPAETPYFRGYAELSRQQSLRHVRQSFLHTLLTERLLYSPMYYRNLLKVFGLKVAELEQLSERLSGLSLRERKRLSYELFDLLQGELRQRGDPRADLMGERQRDVQLELERSFEALLQSGFYAQAIRRFSRREWLWLRAQDIHLSTSVLLIVGAVAYSTDTLTHPVFLVYAFSKVALTAAYYFDRDQTWLADHGLGSLHPARFRGMLSRRRDESLLLEIYSHHQQVALTPEDNP